MTGKVVHRVGCPLERTPDPVFFCAACGRGVEPGEPGWRLEEALYCEDCVDAARFWAGETWPVSGK